MASESGTEISSYINTLEEHIRQVCLSDCSVFFISLLSLLSFPRSFLFLCMHEGTPKQALSVCTPELCRFLRNCEAFFFWPLRGMNNRHQIAGGIHFTYTLDTHWRVKVGKATHMHIRSVFKMGPNDNGGNCFCIINEPGFILIFTEYVLSSLALAHLSFSLNICK